MLCALTVLSMLAAVSAQQAGTFQPEVHPPLVWDSCTTSGCASVTGQVVLDANWRWLHITK